MPLNIDLLQILLHIFNFLILAGGLTFLLFKPINKFLNDREELLAKSLKENEDNAAQLRRLKTEYEEKLNEVNLQIINLKREDEKNFPDKNAL